MTTHVLIDLSGIAHPIWHVSGQDPDPDHVSTATIARVRQIASANPKTTPVAGSRNSAGQRISSGFPSSFAVADDGLYFAGVQSGDVELVTACHDACNRLGIDAVSSSATV